MFGARLRLFFVLSLIYALAAFQIVALRYDDPLELVATSLAVAFHDVAMFLAMARYLIPLLLVLPFLVPWQQLRPRLPNILLGFTGVTLLQFGFSFMKSSIPNLVPFYADTALAAIDQALHLGNDPWVLAHSMAQDLSPEFFTRAYLQYWSIPAFAFPVILALVDGDADRIKRFSLLYLACWVLLGTVLAIAFSSAGPVFHDRIFGGDRFADLTARLDASGLAGSDIGRVQDFLWNAYVTARHKLGSGISAFPSVHLGIAMLSALYLAERSRWLLPLGLGFAATILFTSVYSGYHYAIDGYASIAIITVLWSGMKMRHSRRSAQQNCAPA